MSVMSNIAGNSSLEYLIDFVALQKLMNDFYAVAEIPMSLIDNDGKLLVGVGWQDICTKFHRKHPITCEYCIESDTQLSTDLKQGEFRLYRCKNGMWDMATPIFVAGERLGYVFTGQFFFEDEQIDRDFFRAQAKEYGFDKDEYLTALDRVPRISREKIDGGMKFFLRLADMLSQLGHSNAELERLLEERGHLTESLQDSTNRLNQAQEIADLGSWELNAASGHLILSDHAYRIFGFEPKEKPATFETLLECVHNHDRITVFETFNESMRKNRDGWEIEHRIVHCLTGETRIVHQKCEHFRDNTGKIIRSVGMVHDITDRRLAEKKIEQESQQRQLALDAAKMGWWQYDPVSRMAYWDEGYKRIFGVLGYERPNDEILNQIIHPADLPELWKAVEKALNPADPQPYATEYRIVRPDNGETRWIEAHGIATFEGEGKNRYASNFVGTVSDITERKQIDAELARSEEKYRDLVTLAPAFIYEIDFQSMRFTLVNDLMCDFVGYTREEMLKTNPMDLLDEQGRVLFQERVRQWLAGEQPQGQVEYKIYDRHGNPFWVLLNSTFTANEHGQPLGATVIAYDITDRKNAEEALRESEERFRLALANAPIVVATMDKELRYTWIYNQRTQPTDNVLGKTDKEVLPENAEELTELKRSVLETGKTARKELWINSAGHRVYLDTYIEPLRDRNGNINGVGIATMNLTDKRLIEEALRESEERLRMFVEHAPAAIAMFDREMDYIAVSRRWMTDLGIEDQLVIGRNHYEVFPDVPDRWKDIHQRCMAGEVMRSDEDRFDRFDGSTQWLRWEVRPWHNQPDEIGGIVIFSEEITHRKQAEEAIQISERKLRELIDTANSIILRWDRHGKIVFINNFGSRFFGYEEEELVGQDVNIIVPRTESDTGRSLETLVNDILANPDHFTYVPNENICKDGSNRWVAWTNRAIRNESGDIEEILAIGNDITDLKRVERELITARDELEDRVAERTAEVSQQADQLRALAAQLSRTEQQERRRLATILHDHIQQLIVAARMQVQWIKRDSDPQRLLATARGVDGILREALEASRSLTIDLSPPVLHHTGLSGSLSWLSNRMKEKHQFTVHVRTDSKAEPAKEEVRLLLFECVRELLFNAVKHAGVNEADVILMRTENGNIRLIIEDEGVGFDPQTLDYSNIDRMTFGLFSIRERIGFIDGTMQIETGIGNGTRVTLTVPAAALVEAEKTVTKQGVDTPPVEALNVEPKKECRVLIVDDHKIMREGLSGLLQFESDINVVGEAESGPQAIELADKLSPDVIIMDINLGEMDGVEATRFILGKHPEIKVIGLSMHIDQDIAMRMRDAGAISYLTKGGPSEDLIETIRTCGKD